MLDKHRKKIDQIDAQIIKLLAARKEQILAIKKYKLENRVKVKDTSREDQLRELWATNANKHDLTLGELYPIYDQILNWSRTFQDARPLRIAVPIVAKTLKEALVQIKQAQKEGADLLELRFDYFPNPNTKDLARLLIASKMPKILTIRIPEEGGHYQGTPADRRTLFQFAIDHKVEFIDLEFASKLRFKNLKQTKLILSHHDFKKTPNNLKTLYKKIATDKQKPHLIKIVTTAQTPSDNQKIYDLLKIAPTDSLIALAMGPHGRATRISTPSLGAYLTFASLSAKTTSAPGQYSVKELRKNLRNIALIGGRGVGKSHYAAQLVAKTGQPLIQTDQLIQELAGLSIPQIIKKYGWPFFRELEYQALTKALQAKGAVIDCGGGIVCEQDQEGNQTFSQRKAALLQQAQVVHLKAPLKTQLARLTHDKTRPKLTKLKNLEAELKATMKLRLPWYEKVADKNLIS